MKATSSLILVAMVFALALDAQAQTLDFNAHVVVTGNSLAQFQAGFQTEEFPLLNPQDVMIHGMNSYTCAGLLRLVLYLVPTNTDVVVLLDSTNDIRTGVSVPSHMSCIKQTISMLLQRSPALRVVVVNTPPWTHWDPCTNTYRDDSVVAAIEAYNTAYADPVGGLQATWPVNVRVADAWTPSVDQEGWAIPQYMIGPCGVHPGNEGVWSSSWQHFADGYTGIVMQAVELKW